MLTALYLETDFLDIPGSSTVSFKYADFIRFQFHQVTSLKLKFLSYWIVFNVNTASPLKKKESSIKFGGKKTTYSFK